MFPNYTELGGRILALAMGAYIERIRFPRLGILTTRVSQANPQEGITVQNIRAAKGRKVEPSDAFPASPDRDGQTIRWTDPFWWEIPWYVDDDEMSRLMSSDRLFSEQVASNIARLVADADRYVLGEWTKAAMLFHPVDATDGFGATSAAFKSEYSLGIHKIMEDESVPDFDRRALLNVVDEANVRSLDGVAKADERGTGIYVPTFFIGTYYGSEWFGTNNMPLIGNHKDFEGDALTAFGTVRVNDGDGVAVDSRQLTYDGGGNPLPGDLFTVTGSSLRHKIWRVKDSKIDFYPGVDGALADNATLTQVETSGWRPSLIGTSSAFGYAPVDISGRAEILMGLHYEETMLDPGTQLNLTVEVRRANKRTIITFGTYLYAGANKPEGMGILGPDA